MRQAALVGALVVVAGVIAGVVGGAVVAHLTPKPPAPASAKPRVAMAPVVPASWDSRLLGRVGELEARVAALHDERDAGQAKAPAPEPPTEHQLERQQHYEVELKHREKLAEQHAAEEFDEAWARPQAQSMTEAFKKIDFTTGARVVDVDCRGKTCAATFEFPTPIEGLTALQQRSDGLAVDGCNGYTAIPTPPTSAGPYSMTLFYTCR
jgi:hypothetical protein